MSNPFDALAGRDTPVAPRPEFAAALRRRLDVLLASPDAAVPPIPIPRSIPMPNTALTPYLAVHDAAAALAFYAAAFDAVETVRMVMDDGRVGHAELRIGAATVYLADEFPDIGVVSPRTLGATTVTLHLEVDDVDRAYARAVAAGASAHTEPADQPHGARHGTLVDPFGHRWMLSQQTEVLTADELRARMATVDATVVDGPSQPLGMPASSAGRGGIWAALNYADATAAIGFLVDVFGFEAQLVVPGADAGVVEHSQLRWPEGGTVQAATARRGNVYSERPTGTDSLYVITADPQAVWARCRAAGVEVVQEPAAPDYDPDGLVFTVRDPEGNLWSFGTYAGEE